MADRSVSVPMTLNDLERWDARGQIYQRDLLNNARTGRPRTTKFGRITHAGNGVCLWVPQGGGPHQRSPFFGVPFYLCVLPLSQNYHI